MAHKPDHLTQGRSIGFNLQKGVSVRKPAPTRSFDPRGTLLANPSYGGNPQGIIRGPKK